MKIILLKNNYKLGKLGELINIKPGYAQNFLIPKGEAIVATKENIKYFKIKKNIIYIKFKNMQKLVKTRVKKIKNLNKINIEAQSNHKGKLFGSIGIRDIFNKIKENNINISKKEIHLPNGILRKIGIHKIKIYIQNKIKIDIFINIINKIKF